MTAEDYLPGGAGPYDSHIQREFKKAGQKNAEAMQLTTKLAALEAENDKLRKNSAVLVAELEACLSGTYTMSGSASPALQMVRAVTAIIAEWKGENK